LFLPVGDSPNPPGIPWVNYTLIAANVIVFLMLVPLSGQAPDVRDPALLEYLTAIAQERNLGALDVRQMAASISRYDLVVFRHGFRPSDPSAPDIFTAMFLHGGWLHLLGNMLFLWIYGDNVEHRLGKLGYLAAYLGTGVAATLGDGLLRMGSGIPSVGASGAISGVLGFYFLWFPRNRVRVWVFLFPLFANIIELPARLVLGFYLIFDNLLPLLLSGGAGGVSHGAHIGGFAAGWVLALALNRSRFERPELELRSRPTTRPPTAGQVDRFRSALAAGDWEEAAEWYFGSPHSLTRRELSAMDKLLLAETLEVERRPRAALAAYQRALGDHPHGPGRVRAHLGAARVLMGPMKNPTAAYQHLYGALEEDPSQEEMTMARAMLAELSHRVRTLPRKLPH
jgi:membrane associated rhomboid family serine protease